MSKCIKITKYILVGTLLIIICLSLRNRRERRLNER